MLCQFCFRIVIICFLVADYQILYKFTQCTRKRAQDCFHKLCNYLQSHVMNGRLTSYMYNR